MSYVVAGGKLKYEISVQATVSGIVNILYTGGGILKFSSCNKAGKAIVLTFTKFTIYKKSEAFIKVNFSVVSAILLLFKRFNKP